MSIRPVDLQVMLPRSAEVNRINNNENNRPEAQQQQFAQMLQKKTEQDQQQVVSTFKADKNAVDKDGSNKNGRDGSKKQQKKDGEDVRAQVNAVYENKGILDISV